MTSQRATYPMTDGMPNFAGASLSAFVKLGRRKGYRLVGVNRYGYNAFFVRNGLGDDLLPEIEVRDCFGHPKVVWGNHQGFALGRGMNDGRPNHTQHLTAAASRLPQSPRQVLGR